MSQTEFDVAVIGAGVVGCAVASRLARSGKTVVLLEREPREATGTTARNSGVIHGGLYYPPNSRKARTCVAGKRLLYAWARERAIPHRRIGKLVVARDAEGEAALAGLLENAERSGATGCRMVGREEIARLEPALPPTTARAALLSEETGVVDPHELTRSYLVDAEHHGATWAPQAPVEGIEILPNGFSLQTGRGPVSVERIVNAAGLFADEVAGFVGLDRPVRACRGDYFRLRTDRRYERLIYPVKRPDDPGLGVHLTIELDGRYRIGPDWTWVDDKRDYAPAEHKHAEFLAATRRLLGDIAPEQLTYDSCGLRPKLVGPGEPAADFEIVEQPAGAVHLLGIESPGLTAALALADEVVELMA